MKKRIIVIVSICVVNVLLQLLIRFSAEFVKVYHKSVYPLLENTLGKVTSVCPISVAEILLYAFLLGLIVYIIFGFREKPWKEHVFNMLYHAGIIGNVLFLSYTLTCGINYHAPTFAEKNEIVLQDYTGKELEKVGRILIRELNISGEMVTRDKNGIMQVSKGIAVRTKSQMINLGKKYTGFSGYTTKPKPLLNSVSLSYMQISGIFSPFTMEANYNANIIPYNIPFTTCHEIAHTKGYMREEEANFIAFLACIDSDDEEFRYSGLLLGWVYVGNAIAEEDLELYKELGLLLNQNIKKDLQANKDFWDKYDGKIGELSDRVNDRYLKANSQSDGIKSYGRIVDYIVNYYMLEEYSVER